MLSQDRCDCSACRYASTKSLAAASVPEAICGGPGTDDRQRREGIYSVHEDRLEDILSCTLGGCGELAGSIVTEDQPAALRALARIGNRVLHDVVPDAIDLDGTAL